MGIRRFTTLLNEKPVLEEIKLRNLKVIIDGNCLLFQIYRLDKNWDKNGGRGDYKEFASKARKFLQEMKSCGIEMYIVFKGAFELNEKKFKKEIEKLKNSIILANFSNNNVLPIMSYEVLKNVLDELSIKHATCDFDSQKEIVYLASAWKCPIITDDSEFCIYELPEGVILKKYFDMSMHTNKNGNPYMSAKLYKIEKFREVMGLRDKSFMPLLATIFIDDVTSDDESFLLMFKKVFSTDFPTITQVLDWLKNKSNISEVFKERFGELNLELRDPNILMDCISSYKIKNSTYLKLIFEKYGEIEDNFVAYDTGELVNKYREKAPKWFQIKANKGKLTETLMNVFTSNQVRLSLNVENYDYSTSHDCALSIRRLIYGLVAGDREIIEFTRVDRKVAKKKVTPRLDLSNTVQLPLLENIPKLNTKKKMEIYLDLFHEKHLWFLEYPRKEQLFLSSLIFWFWKSEMPNAGKFHIISLLLCFYDESIFDYVGKKKYLNDAPLYKLPKREKNEIFELDVFHTFSQFQSCFYSLMELNKILQEPFEPISPQFFNGSTLVNVYKQLKLSYNEFRSFQKVECLEKSRKKATIEEISQRLWKR